MTRRDRDTSLEGLEDSLRSQVDDDLKQVGLASDFDSMMKRAEEMGASMSKMRDSAREEPTSTAELSLDEKQVRRDETLLAPLVAALRDRTDRDLLRRKAEGPWPTPFASPRRRMARIAASVLAVAASVALVLSLDFVRAGQRSAADQHSVQAQDASDVAGATGGAAVSRSARTRRAGAEAEHADAEGPGVTGATEETTGGEPDLGDAVVPWKPARVPLKRQFGALDRRGQAQWRAGQLRAAESTFWRLVKVGGRDPRVEMAFAELFALVRQRGGDMSHVWTRYLRRFPRGRYAGDAKAGLCRRASGQARARCWEEYEDSFPNGIHHATTRP